jgi:hypothetical protein
MARKILREKNVAQILFMESLNKGSQDYKKRQHGHQMENTGVD